MKRYVLGQPLLWKPKDFDSVDDTPVKGVVTEVAHDHCIVRTQGNNNNYDDMSLWLDDDTEADFKGV